MVPTAPDDLQRSPHERGGEEENMAMSGKDELTPREREVLELVLARWHDKEIADHLVISVRTVETHVARLFSTTTFGRSTTDPICVN
ncbi:MAG: helix-turn-helix transcriptional regulator [Dehalococcoidia bacterium]|nr:helix-turn-helix transcriptional regulator [Dehalococcoidia bacterium]